MCLPHPGTSRNNEEVELAVCNYEFNSMIFTNDRIFRLVPKMGKLNGTHQVQVYAVDINVVGEGLHTYSILTYLLTYSMEQSPS